MSNDLLRFLALFARLFGFFLLSPLFGYGGIPLWARFGMLVTCSLLFAPSLTESALWPLPLDVAASLFTLTQELLMGYLLGFLFSLFFEAVGCAGELVGGLSGFSTSTLLDPVSQQRHPLLAQLFTLTLFALFLSLDLHHPLLRLLYTSFHTTLADLTRGIVQATSLLFYYAITYALFPMTLLLLLFFSMGWLARYFPALQLFWIGLPLQLLVGTYLLGQTIGFFTQIMQRAYYEWGLLAKKMFFSL